MLVRVFTFLFSANKVSRTRFLNRIQPLPGTFVSLILPVGGYHSATVLGTHPLIRVINSEEINLLSLYRIQLKDDANNNSFNGRFEEFVLRLPKVFFFLSQEPKDLWASQPSVQLIAQ